MENKDTLYARWLNGDISKEEADILKKSGEWEELESIINATESLSLPKLEVDRSYGKLNRPKKKTKTKLVALPLAGWISVAASIAILIIGWAFFFDGAQVISAPNSITLEHQLPDASLVILNDGSSIEYSNGTWESTRKVNLEGEAFFKVNPGSTFTVETKKGNVEVKGTQFNVRCWGNHFYIDCFEGKVQVEIEGTFYELVQGQSIQWLDNKLERNSIINGDQPNWINGVSQFEKEELEVVLKEIGRQYNIEVNASGLGGQFTGSFNQNDGLKASLDNICIPKGLSYQLNEDQTIVTINNK